jgi:hypothetical protein
MFVYRKNLNIQQTSSSDSLGDKVVKDFYLSPYAFLQWYYFKGNPEFGCYVRRGFWWLLYVTGITHTLVLEISQKTWAVL